MMMEGDAGRKAVIEWVRNRENARAGVEQDPTAASIINKDEASSSSSSSLMPTMTPAALKAAAVANEGYETPELNDRLFLHYKGFRAIENLEPYCNLKALFLDTNGLARIEGLSHLHHLRCLYLQNNLIERIEGLEGLTSLVTLELSHNRIFKVEGLSHLPNLQTLNLAHNYLKDVDSISHLSLCLTLNNVDLSNNDMEEFGVVEEVLVRVPSLVSMNLAGNGVVTNTPQFRKKVICAMPKLRYLDRPVFEAEKLASEAWGQGGREAEIAAREAYSQKQKDEHRAQLQAYRDWQADIRQRKQVELAQKEKEGVKGGPTETEQDKRRREEREAAARAQAEAEREAITQPGAITKMGASFWAKGPGGEEERDVFGQPRSSVGKEIFAEADVVVVEDLPPLVDGLEIEEGEKEKGGKVVEQAVDSSAVLLEVD